MATLDDPNCVALSPIDEYILFQVWLLMGLLRNIAISHCLLLMVALAMLEHVQPAVWYLYSCSA